MLNTTALTLANILWLLAAMAFVIAPHVARLPIWVTVVCVAAGAWRWWIARHGLRTPAWWLMAAIAIAITAGAYVEYKRLFGRDVGVTLLIVMLCLKVLEMRMKRDAMLVIFMGFFLAMTNFLYSQTMMMGLYMLLCVWIFVATLIGFNRINSEPTLRERAIPAMWLMVQALPLMLVLFFLFPRLSGPLWTMPQDGSGLSGLSDKMSPGDISKLSKSDAVAFRVEFEGAIPENLDLYWRGPVLGAHRGRSWEMYDVLPANRIEYLAESDPINYRVTLQPHNKTWLFALDFPNKLPPESGLLGDYQLRSVTPVTALKAYDVTSHLRYRVGRELSPRSLEPYLRLNRSNNPRAQAYALELREKYPDNGQLIEALLAQFNQQFTYTLEPRALGADSVDEFLFETKQGFCEHYAGSFVFVLRAAGIPARVVTGYQGGEVNPITRQLIVRQADAHAWTEVWLKEFGWLRVDPTFAVSPLRIRNGFNAAMGPQGLFDSIAAADGFGLLKRAAFTWDAVNAQWNRWVVGFNSDRQRGLFDSLGIKDTDWRTLSVALIIGVFVFGGGVGAFVLARAYMTRKPPDIAAYDRFCERLAKVGITREKSEGPAVFLARIERECEREKPALAQEARAVIRAYIDARYAPQTAATQTTATRTFIALAKRFRT
jgi:protein-glutamine gamma-glutamyltransferase